MPSILDQKFQHSILIPRKIRSQVQDYMERNVGGRTYWLSARVGGKKWCLWNQESEGNTVKLEFDGEVAETIGQEITMLILRS